MIIGHGEDFQEPIQWAGIALLARGEGGFDEVISRDKSRIVSAPELGGFCWRLSLASEAQLPGFLPLAEGFIRIPGLLSGRELGQRGEGVGKICGRAVHPPEQGVNECGVAILLIE